MTRTVIAAWLFAVLGILDAQSAHTITPTQAFGQLLASAAILGLAWWLWHASVFPVRTWTDQDDRDLDDYANGDHHNA
jgi:hypothetical protein